MITLSPSSSSPPSPQSPEQRTIRRWRRAFLAIYLVFTFGAVVLTGVSVLAVTFGGAPLPPVKGPRIDERGAKPDEIRACHRSLERLLTDLHHETFAIQAKALRYDTDPATEWRNWSQAWNGRWRTLDWRCRFSELSGRGMPAIDRMAAIHSTLAELERSYSGVMDRFIETYSDRLRKLRRDLSELRSMIDRGKGPSVGPSENTGAKR